MKFACRTAARRTPRDVKIMGYFSGKIESDRRNRGEHRLVPGIVIFKPIATLAASGEVMFKITARAKAPGNHMFKAEVVCEAAGREAWLGTHDAVLRRRDHRRRRRTDRLR